MASGFSFSGGVPRCFAYWQEFQKCYAQADNPQQCVFQKDDYVECLHHKKEIARAEAVQAEFHKRAERDRVEGKKAADVIAAGAITGVGLIKRDG